MPAGAVESPAPLADDRRSADDRDLPSRTDALGAALSGVVGGPVGRHALIGRQRFFTPLRVMLAIAVVFMALGYTTKAACLQTVGDGPADQRVANWQNSRAYYELCYSDTVPLYTAELLNQGKFPYKSSWIETDASGEPRIQYDGDIAVRYMEYPVLTGLYQYLSMALAKTYTAVATAVSLPVDRRGGDVLQHRRVRAGAGVAGDGVGDVAAGGPPGVGRRAGGGVAAADLPDVHQLRRAGHGVRGGRDAGVGASKTGARGGADRARRGGQALPAAAARAAGAARRAHRPGARVRPRRRARRH